MVVWLIGLSGAGKTTIGRRVCELQRKRGRPVFMLDGDNFREMMGNDLGHSMDDRRENAWRMCRFCRELETQGIDVVCCILSLFPETREWNRKNLENYHEVYVRVPFDELVRRDSKGLYKRALAGEATNVAGVDLHFPEPVNADLILDNDGPEDRVEEFARSIADAIGNSQ